MLKDSACDLWAVLVFSIHSNIRHFSGVFIPPKGREHTEEQGRIADPLIFKPELLFLITPLCASVRPMLTLILVKALISIGVVERDEQTSRESERVRA